MQRTITATVSAPEMAEGAGARVRRALPNSKIGTLDPFILLDEFFVRPPAGFPDHPHRGFEIVTYILEGGFRHRDSMGNDYAVMAGGLQKINTGGGIVHAELPGTEGMNHGLQLWINLPRDLKAGTPEYQEVPADRIPESTGPGYRVRTVVGPQAPTSLHTPVLYLDVTVEPNASWGTDVPPDYRGFIYVLRGAGLFGADATPGKPGQLLLLGEGDAVRAETQAGEPLRFALIVGRPLGQPIHLHGPYVD